MMRGAFVSAVRLGWDARLLLPPKHVAALGRPLYFCHGTDSTPPSPPKSPQEIEDRRLLRELSAKIRFSGPITIADYMREVLTNPIKGFYMKPDVLGAHGHFVTSPEISQMFGECMSMWLLTEWMKMGQPKPLQIVELGPGNGTLLNDILRTISKLKPDVIQHLSLHLVEVSPDMRQLQERSLCPTSSSDKTEKDNISKFGCPVSWYDHVRDVPRNFSIFIAHEFFDALPIHRFRKTKEGWREILIDVDPTKQEDSLRYILSRHETPSCYLIDQAEVRPELELSPQSGILLKSISERVVEDGGLFLIADYGNVGETEDTLRAFRRHKQVDPLELPGTADITADVDFKYLSTQIDPDCSWFGPITQSEFLHAAGIHHRCDQLSRAAKDKKEAEMTVDAYRMLTDSDKMGSRFKFVALFPKTMAPIHDRFPPTGFPAKNSTDRPSNGDNTEEK